MSTNEAHRRAGPDRRSVSLAVVWMVIFAALAPASVVAHGGVSFEDDVCVLKVGPFLMHFTGYVPSIQKNQEFCEDIPTVGPAIVVLDFVDKPLRDMTVEFRLLNDAKNIGNSATFEDLGSLEEIDANTILRLDPQTYPRGSIIVEHSFPEKGRFIGLLHVLPKGETREFVAVFPFSVGLSPWLNWAWIGLGLLTLIAGGIYLRRIWQQ